eukprot:Nk52_evm8s305 gene=Nk52_evmTU8s305
MAATAASSSAKAFSAAVGGSTGQLPSWKHIERHTKSLYRRLLRQAALLQSPQEREQWTKEIKYEFRKYGEGARASCATSNNKTSKGSEDAAPMGSSVGMAEPGTESGMKALSVNEVVDLLALGESKLGYLKVVSPRRKGGEPKKANRMGQGEEDKSSDESRNKATKSVLRYVWRDGKLQEITEDRAMQTPGKKVLTGYEQQGTIDPQAVKRHWDLFSRQVKLGL